MVAPNGARRTLADHPRVPITVDQIVADAIACHFEGAGGLHAHVRDEAGRHVLDVGLYRALIEKMAVQCPDMLVQVTTEAVGRYQPDEQIAMVRALQPKAVSVAIKEVMQGDQQMCADFYHWAHESDIAIQHIVYVPDEISWLADLVAEDCVPKSDIQLLMVLGRYVANQESRPEMLDPFVDRLARTGLKIDWAVCAFGKGETDCLKRSVQLGGKVRVGFENSLYRADGSLAESNAERVREIATWMDSV